MKYQADELSRDEDVLAVLHSLFVNYNVYEFKFYISLSFEISSKASIFHWFKGNQGIKTSIEIYKATLYKDLISFESYLYLFAV